MNCSLRTGSGATGCATAVCASSPSWPKTPACDIGRRTVALALRRPYARSVIRLLVADDHPLKDAEPEELMRGIRAAAHGELVRAPRAAARLTGATSGDRRTA